MINQHGFSLGVVGMSDVDTKDFFSEGVGAEPGNAVKIGDMDLSNSPDKQVSKKTSHNFKRVLQRSPARSIAAAAGATLVVSGLLFYTLGDSATEMKAGRDMAGLDTVSFNYNTTGRDQLTQQQVDHIQAQGEERARSAATNAESYTPMFADVVAASVQDESMNEDLQQTNVSFEGAVKGSNYVDPNSVKDASLATSINYGPAAMPSSADGINYASTGNSGMPQPAALAMQQGAGSPNATYQTNDGSGGGAGGNSGGGGGDGGMGAGGPNATGIDPSVEALRQSLEDDYNQQQAYDQQYSAEQDARLQEQRQYIQEATQQRQQASSQAVQQQQQAFSQQPQSNMGFTASAYIPKQTQATAGVWRNDMSAATQRAANAAEPQPEEEEVKNLASHIVRVGTTWNVVVENEVNTDNGTTVFARALSGPYAGSRLIGTINSAGLANRSAGVVFETLIPERRNKNAIPIKAVGMTLGDLNTHVATSVNRHYLQRYSALIAQGITGGYGEAYSENTGVTSQVINPDGSVTTVSNKEKPDSEEIRGQVIGQLGSELEGEFGAIRARPTTFTINQGTPLTIMFVENMNNKTSKTDSIKVGQGSFSNTSSYGMQPRTLN